ncbi:Phage terminase large subunit [compost metagenome]
MALAEKQRRMALATTQQTNALVLRRPLLELDLPPTPATHGSLVLDRNHPLSDLYYRKKRFKVYWGGRGSAKSWGVAEALIRLAVSMPLRILCTREYQNSIKDSSHKLLKDTIARLGLDGWFVVTADSIKSKLGAEFIFKGLHNNEQGIKSTEGIDICWVEEAQTVPEGSWRTLLPTIRKTDSEVWVTFNLIEETDATYKRFVTNADDRMIVHKVNYDSNPYFATSPMYGDMLADKRNDYHLYEHVWLGMPQVVSSAIILSGKYRVAEFDDDLWKQADRVFYGADFGFAQDPATLIRFFVIERASGNILYVSHEAYQTGVELNEYADFYDQVPGSREWPIMADAARPEIISHVRSLGFSVSAAEKWDGSVKDGIAHLRGFAQIIIHPRCPATAREAHAYRYKVDKRQVDDNGQPLVLPVVVDANNHAWDAVRYGLDGYIQRRGAGDVWKHLAAQAAD